MVLTSIPVPCRVWDISHCSHQPLCEGFGPAEVQQASRFLLILTKQAVCVMRGARSPPCTGGARAADKQGLSPNMAGG